MHIVRELQSAIFLWLLIERYPFPCWWRTVRRDHLWLELGMRSAKITSIGNLSVGQPLVHIGMAAAAKLLLGIFHRSRAFMLGMAFNAAPLGPAKALGDFTRHFSIPIQRSFGKYQPFGIGMIVDIFMASDTGTIGHSNKCFGMARLAIHSQSSMRGR